MQTSPITKPSFQGRVTALTFVLSVTALTVLPAALLAQPLAGLPQASPSTAAIQTVGVTDIRVDYHRPAVKGRQVWGGLVPDGQVWRAGANDNTVVSFSTPVQVEGLDLAAGSYGLHMIPNGNAWTVIFSSNYTSWGSFSYQEAEDVLRVNVTATTAPFTEDLFYGFTGLSNSAATLFLQWEKKRVPVHITVSTQELTLAEIRNQLRSLPGFSWQGWSAAAAYCQTNDFNHTEALGWIDRSIQLEENFQNLSVRAGLLLQTGDPEAQSTLTRALEIGTENQINNTGYRLLLGNQTEFAIQVFRSNVEKNPESWNTHDSLAEALATVDNTSEALTHYRHARQLAPETQYQRLDQTISALESGS